MISVVVPFYNEEAHIAACLAALENQTAERQIYELIFVDNNSTDGSADIVRSRSGVTLLQESEQGDYAARNRGIKAARGRIVAFTDADTAPHPEWISAIAAVMEEDPELQLVVGSLAFDARDPLLQLLQAYEFEKTDFVFESKIDEVLFAYTSNMAVRKQFLDEFGPFQSFRRNADMFLLRAVLDRSGRRAVCFAQDIRVQRLEITGFRAYLGKMLLYGDDARVYGEASGFRPISFRERMQVLKRTIRRNRYSVPQSLTLVGLLVAGGVAYEGARRLGWKRRPTPGTGGI